MVTVFLSLFLVMALLFNVHAATSYVDNAAGSGCPSSTYDPSTRTSGSGSDTCYATIKNGVTNMASQDLLRIRGGTYTEATQIDGPWASGISDSQRTIIENYTGEVVTYKVTLFSHFRMGDNSDTYITIRADAVGNFILDGQNSSSGGINLRSLADNNRFENLEVKDLTGDCVNNTDGSNNNEYIGNKIHNCGSDHFTHGMYLSGDNNTVTRNEVYNISGYGIHIFLAGAGDSSGNTVTYNKVYDFGQDTGGEAGILVDGGNSTIAYNWIYNPVVRDAGIQVTFGDNGSDNNKIYYNTIIDVSTGIDIRAGDDNNIVKNNATKGTTTPISDLGTGTTLGGNVCETSDADCQYTGDPGFVTSPTNINLTDSAFALNKAVTISGFNGDNSGAMQNPDFDATSAVENSTPNVLNIQLSNVVSTPAQITNSTGWSTGGIACAESITGVGITGNSQIDLTLNCSVVSTDNPTVTYNSSTGNAQDSEDIGGTGTNSRVLGFTAGSIVNNVLPSRNGIVGFGVISID